MKNKLMKLLDSIDNDLEPIKAIKIYESLLKTAKSEFDTIINSNKVCNHCGSPLKDWEKDTCGPCKIKSDKFPEDADD